MLGAGSTGQGELLFKCLASAMDADGGVAGGDSGGSGEGVQCALAKINFADDLAVLRLDGGKDLLDAAADDILCRRVGGGLGGQVASPAFERAVFGGAVAVVVDNGVAQDAIEPGYGRLGLVERRGLFHGADVGVLQDVFGGGRRIDTTPDKLEEPASLKDEIVDGFGLHKVGRSWITGAEIRSAPVI